MMMKTGSILFFLFTCLTLNAQKANFLLKFKDEVTPHKITGVFVKPGEKIRIEPLFERDDEHFEIRPSAGTIEVITDNLWLWQAPKEKGIYPITVVETTRMDTIRLNCIVLVPLDHMENGKLNGYRIGKYPSSTNELYNLPDGFIEVTKENENTLISPHYKLKDFLCKQAGSYPKYVVLKERGILKLEMIQNYLKSEKIEMSKFHFISGYRTPWYNKSIGNVMYSRHVFGDAFDVYIDEDGNGRMDDLNGDGKSDAKDVRFLHSKINKLYSQPWYKPFIGGLGLYKPNSRRTGFLHIDSRGQRARWGE